MLNKALLDKDVSEFISKNRKKDLPALILKGSPFEKVSIQELAVQIKGLNVAEKKFQEFFKTEGILYPPKLNLEQTSSEITAKYKASLVQGEQIADLTGGFGIDSFFLSQSFERLDYFEINKNLAETAAHNFKILNAGNITVKAKNGLDYLKNHQTNYDWIYADPARRDSTGGKVFRLEDCEPDIPGHIGTLFANTNNILLKTSPILDISAGLEELYFVSEIHVVAVGNEVKELLWILKKGFKEEPVIKTLNFEKDQIQEFEGTKNNFETEEITYSAPQKYLYEPNSAIMKSGLFQSLALKTNTRKIHQHSHLYTSADLKNFPGRIFQITDIKEYKPSNLKKYFKSKKANVTIRNFPDTVAEIRKKLKIKEGGETYLFFTTNLKNEKILIFCKKV